MREEGELNEKATTKFLTLRPRCEKNKVGWVKKSRHVLAIERNSWGKQHYGAKERLPWYLLAFAIKVTLFLLELFMIHWQIVNLIHCVH